jgi:FkbM family methyltransferase
MLYDAINFKKIQDVFAESIEEIPPCDNSGHFISWAQNFEDVMLWRALNNIKKGFYIDVGACDPHAESVTLAFYLRGWRGVNVDVVEDNWQRLRAARLRDVNIHAALGASEGSKPLFLVDGGNGLTTLHRDIAHRQAWDGRNVEEVECRMSTLAQICREYANDTIHFLKIDVEGWESEVIEGADFDRFRPWIILAETTLPTTHPDHARYDAKLSEAKYKFVYFDGLNRFYIALEHWQALSPSFNSPPNVFDNFVRASEYYAEINAVASNARSKELQHELEKALAEGEAFEQDLYEVNRHAAWLAKTNRDLRWCIDVMNNSFSWKVTAPYRDARRKWKRIFGGT